MTGRMMVLTAGLALMVVPQANAQDVEARHARMSRRAPGGGHMIDRAVGRVMDRRYELNLSDDQLARLNDLRGNARSAMAPIREEISSIHEEVRDGSLTREDSRERMKSVQEQATAMATEFHDQLNEILEPEQEQMLRGGMARQGSQRGAARRGRSRRMSRRDGDHRY